MMVPNKCPFRGTAVLRKILPLIALFISLSVASSAQGTFQIGIGTKGFESGNSIRVLPDGGFIIAGYTTPFGQEEADMLLVRTDANGQALWSQTYGGPEREVMNDVVHLPDGGYMAIGEKYQLNRKEGEFLTILKTDVSGNLQWKKMFDEDNNETEAYSIEPTSDGNYIITGTVRSMNAVANAFYTVKRPQRSLFLLKVDAGGNKIWSRKLSFAENNRGATGVSVISASDGSYIITGNLSTGESDDGAMEKQAINESAEGEKHLLLAKIKPDGSLSWAKSYHQTRMTSGYSVAEKKEGGFIVAGICTPDNTRNVDLIVLSVSANGEVQWSKTFGGAGYESAADVLQSPDGGFVISGGSLSFSEIGDLLVFKTDNSGNLQWAKIYGDKNGEHGGAMALTADGPVLTGEASIGAESFDVLMLKTDWNGNSGCWGKEVSLAIKNLQLRHVDLTGAKTTAIAADKIPPGFKKADMNNIEGKSREPRVIKICD